MNINVVLGEIRYLLGKILRLFSSNGFLEFSLIILCIIPGLVFSYKSIQMPWTEYRIARAYLSLVDGELAQYITAASGFRPEHVG